MTQTVPVMRIVHIVYNIYHLFSQPLFTYEMLMGDFIYVTKAHVTD
jgi:hypothetical protein